MPDMGKTEKVKKEFSEEEANKIRVANEEIRANREKVANELSQKFSKFKTDFLSAPLRKAMNNIVNKEANVMKPCRIDYRKDESYFVFPEIDQVGFTTDVNFTSKED